MFLKVSLFITLKLLSIFHKGSTSENILNQIRLSHERIGQCRLSCISGLSLQTFTQDSSCEQDEKCKNCWNICQTVLISSKKGEDMICSKPYKEDCKEGCQLSCKFLQEVSSSPINNKTTFSLSTNFVSCTLFWKIYGDESTATIYQLYGMDDQVRKLFSNKQKIIPAQPSEWNEGEV